MNVDKNMSEILIKKYHESVRLQLDGIKRVEDFEFPSVDDQACLDIRHEMEVSFSMTHIIKNLWFLGDNFLTENEIGNWKRGNYILFREMDLKKLGLALLPYVAFGILNGGSATSYLDTGKNLQFGGEGIFKLYKEIFEKMQKKYMGYPKGIIPAYIDHCGGYGASYIELKLRHILLLQKKYKETFNRPCHIGFFQMTSPFTDHILEEAYGKIESSPFLERMEGIKELLNSRKTGIQNLIWAFEPVLDQDSGYKFFEFRNEDKKGGKSRLALPGGHGQNFYVLKSIYSQLEEEGFRFAYLGNIDNLGFTINLKSLALMALRGNSAGFEFSFKTRVDKKGGVLVKEKGIYTCLDIGGGINKEIVSQAEVTGLPILFNCATGIFNLYFLNQNIDYIIENLPVRFIEQHKDIGYYAQAEQITWEVLSLLKDPLIFCVQKEKRFLSAKFVLEMFLTCGLYRDSINFPFEKQEIISHLNQGFSYIMRESYGMILHDSKGKWEVKE